MPASSVMTAASDFAPADPKTSGVAATATSLTKGGSSVPEPTIKGGKCTKGGKKSRKKSRKMNGAAKEWVAFVGKVYEKGLAKNSKYRYMQAMKDASRMKKKNKTMKV